MATDGNTGQLMRRQIVRLAASVAADNMESIAEGYLDMDNETVKNIWRQNQGKVEALTGTLFATGPTKIQTIK